MKAAHQYRNEQHKHTQTLDMCWLTQDCSPSQMVLQNITSSLTSLQWWRLAFSVPAPHPWVLYWAGGLAYCRFVAYQWPWNWILSFSMTSLTNMTAFFPWPVHPWHAVYCIFSHCVKLKELWEGTPQCGVGRGAAEVHAVRQTHERSCEDGR